MPIRFGEVIVLLLLAVAFWLLPKRGKATRATTTRSVRDEVPQDAEEAEVVTVQSSPAPSTQRTEPPRATARAERVTVVNVRGRGTLFRCEEHRSESDVETHVCQIDARGRPLGAARVYREPLEQVVKDFTFVGV